MPSCEVAIAVRAREGRAWHATTLRAHAKTTPPQSPSALPPSPRASQRRTSRLNGLFEELGTLLTSRPDLFSDAGLRHSKADVSAPTSHPPTLSPRLGHCIGVAHCCASAPFLACYDVKSAPPTAALGAALRGARPRRC